MIPMRSRQQPSSKRKARQGSRWTIEEHALLIECLRGGEPLRMVCEIMQRTPRSVEARMRLLMPKNVYDAAMVEGGRALAVQRFRSLLRRSPDYDWRARLDQTWSGVEVGLGGDEANRPLAQVIPFPRSSAARPGLIRHVPSAIRLTSLDRDAR